MVDMIETEEWAITKAGQVGGEYLDSIKISDLSRLTMLQYSVYVRCIVSSYLGEMNRLQLIAKDSLPPF